MKMPENYASLKLFKLNLSFSYISKDSHIFPVHLNPILTCPHVHLLVFVIIPSVCPGHQEIPDLCDLMGD